jgi:hypothetical protein
MVASQEEIETHFMFVHSVIIIIYSHSINLNSVTKTMDMEIVFKSDVTII